MNTAESARRLVFKSVGVAEAAALIVGLLYVTGYYVNSIFLRNYGIPDAELIRLEYVKIGFVFWVLTTGIVLLPFGAFYLTWSVRNKSGLPNLYLGWIGNSLNTTVWLGVPLLLSFFATKFEWEFQFKNTVLGFGAFNHAVLVALAILTFAVVVLPFLERLARKSIPTNRLQIFFNLAIEPVRFGCFAYACALIILSCVQIPWIRTVFNRAGLFIAVAVVFVACMGAAIRWVKHIERVRGSTMVYPLIILGLSFFYYLAIASYVFGVYPSIPANRGGRMPVTEAFFEVVGRDHLFQEHRNLGTNVIHGPAYILENSDDAIYFASAGMDKWFKDFIDVHSLRKEDVKYILFRRINDGFPRTSRPPKNP